MNDRLLKNKKQNTESVSLAISPHLLHNPKSGESSVILTDKDLETKKDRVIIQSGRR